MNPIAAELRPQYTILGRFHCREALESVPPFLTYQARAQGLAGFERVFAVKILPADAPSMRPDAGHRLLQGATRANAVKDVRVGQVVDSGTAADGSAYVATEFVFGLNLSGLRSGALVETSGQRTAITMLVAHLAAEISGALAAAHEMDPPVVHGALGLSNVFLTVRGAVKVIDFGQRMAVMPSRLAGGKRVLFPYAAPELLLAGDGSTEADVFALGSMMFEIATGKTPPSARNPRSATDLARALGALSPDLGEVITSLLRMDPTKRPTARRAESAFRQIAVGLSEPELRAHLAGLARKLSTPQGPTPSSADSMVVPVVSMAPPSSETLPERRTAPTGRPPAPSFTGAPRGAEVHEARDVPMNTLPFADLIQSGLAGALPESQSQAGQTSEMEACASDVAFSAGIETPTGTGQVLAPILVEPSSMIELLPDDLIAESLSDGPAVQSANHEATAPTAPLRPPRTPPSAVAGLAAARSKPNMENITTREMDAMFSSENAGTEDPGETISVPQVQDVQSEDDLDDARTNSFSRSMFSQVMANEAPSGFQAAVAEGTNEVVDEQLVKSGVYEATSAPILQAAAIPEYAEKEPEAAASAERPMAEIDDDAGRASEHLPALGGEEDDLDRAVAKAAGKRRLMITLATAAFVALAAAVAGGFIITGRKNTVLPRLAPLPQGLANEEAKVVAPAPVAEEVAKAPAPELSEPLAVEPKPFVVQDSGGPAPRDIQGRTRLTFKTQPSGATVWINGSERGLSPLKAELKERHKALVIIKPGFKWVQEEMNHATLSAERTYILEAASPPNEGNSLIRVECKQANKYPITIDGNQTGLLCPAEVHVVAGEHTVEIYVPWRFKAYANKVVVGERKIRTAKFSK